MARRKRSKQVELQFHRRGGKRKNAGRKAMGGVAGASHRRRTAFGRRMPVHVTWRVLPHVWNLRSRRAFEVLLGAFVGSRDRFPVQLTHFAVLGNHLHLVVEADDSAALARGMQGLGVRLARGLNRLMNRAGKVFADRFHDHVLRSPTEARRALDYVRSNARKHYGRHCDAAASGDDPYTAGSGFGGGATALAHDAGAIGSPRTWLLRVGWKRVGSVVAT